jgi:hypothetical protein
LWYSIDTVNFDCFVVIKEKFMHHDQEEYHEAMLERQRRVEEAVENAEAGLATQEDFDVIRFECGLNKAPSPSSLILKDVFADFNRIFGGAR